MTVLTRALKLEARPLLKWAGGKTQMLAQYEPYLPTTFNAYHELFLGGGAMFFYLHSLGRLKQSYLSDFNLELIQTYWAVRDIPEAVIKQLQEHKAKHFSDYYYWIRDLDRQPDQPLELAALAARMIYLNKTCFNGLYRLNSKGFFNVPIGKYKNPSICDSENLLKVSAAFGSAGVALIHGAYTEVSTRARTGDFVYFDPPYFVEQGTHAFDKYTATGFTFEDHQNLAALVADLTAKGVQVMVSNSNYPFIQDLYSAFKIVEVKGKRHINSKAEKRGEISELLILNY